jgi:hypothetical protein
MTNEIPDEALVETLGDTLPLVPEEPKVRKTISGKRVPFNKPRGTWGHRRTPEERVVTERTGEYYQQEFPEAAIVALVEHQDLNRKQRRYYGIKGEGTNEPRRTVNFVNAFGDKVDVNGVLLEQAQAALDKSQA